jgi:CheY-like chemotaxis protein
MNIKGLEGILHEILFQYKGQYDILQAKDGIEFLYYVVQNLKIICVFIDENMEYMNGSEAVKILRNLERKTHTKMKVFSFTAQGDEATIKKIMDSGADYCIKKPATKTQISKLFEDHHIFIKLESDI